MRKKILVSYIILTAAAVLLFALSAGLRANYGIIINPIAEHSGLDYASVSFVFGIAQLMYGLTQPLWGVLALKKSNSTVLAAGLLMMAAGLAGTAIAHSQLMLTLFFGLIFASGTGAVSFGFLMGAITPALGSERAAAECSGGKVTGVRVTNVPAFVYKEDLHLNYNGKDVVYDICFGGSFFALVDTEKNFGIKVSPETTRFLTDFSSFALQEINRTVAVQHPELDITSVDLVENYCTTDIDFKETDPEAKFALRNVVIFGDPTNPQLDRSPCGTGTSAKLSWLYKKGELKEGEKFVYESFIGTRFIGKVGGTTKVGDIDAVIPVVTGAAYLCGEATWFMDPDDALAKGFYM